jgi:uroporphyrinogen III methyltransferase/synthase
VSLAGRRVLVTRAPAQAPALAEALRARGAEVLVLPTLTLAPPEDPEPLALAARDGAYDLVVFSSHNVVERFFAVQGATLGRARAAAVGRKSAGARSRAWAQATAGAAPAVEDARARDAAVIVPPVHDAASLLVTLEATLSLVGRRVLVPRAPEGRELLIDGLRARGAVVDAPTAYRLVCPPPAVPEVVADVERAEVLTFLSGRALENFLHVLPEARARALLVRACVAVIGPVAAEAAERLAVRVDVVPAEATVEALVEALEAR